MSKHRRVKVPSEMVLLDILGPMIDWLLNNRWAKRILGDEPYDREWTWGGRKFTLRNRGKRAPMGRFGGGWEHSLGVQSGDSDVIVNLWKSSLRITKVKP